MAQRKARKWPEYNQGGVTDGSGLTTGKGKKTKRWLVVWSHSEGIGHIGLFRAHSKAGAEDAALRIWGDRQGIWALDVESLPDGWSWYV